MSNKQHITHIDYSLLFPEVRAALLAELEQHFFTSRYEQLPFDPSDLVVLAQQQLPRSPQVAEALARCTQQWVESEFYSYFMDPHAPDRSHCAGGFLLHCPVLGMLLFDTDAQGGIVGVEYLSLVLQGEQPHERPPSPALRIEYWKGREQ